MTTQMIIDKLQTVLTALEAAELMAVRAGAFDIESVISTARGAAAELAELTREAAAVRVATGQP